MVGALFHQADLRAFADDAIFHADVDDHAAVVVVLAVEDQGAERVGGEAGRGGDALDDRFKHVVDPDARPAAGAEHFFGIESEDGPHFFQHFVGADDGEVDLVEAGDDREVRFEGRVGVGDRLRLNALEGIDQQQCPFAGGEAAGDFVVEVDVAGGIDEVQFVGLPVVDILDGDGAGLHGDAAFAFDVEIVEQLVFEFALRDRPGLEQQLVRERALAVVDVGHDREVANEAGVHESGQLQK